MPSTPDKTAASGDDRNLVSVDENYLAPTFEDRLRLFWEKNSRSILVAVALVLAVILGKGGYEIIHASREKAVSGAYGAAVTPDQLRAFVADHPGHVLGGLAQLRLADEAYSAGDYAAARDAYGKAAGILKTNTFGARARLGAAVSAVQAGAAGDGRAALSALVSDLNLPGLVRAEAAYQLALLAADAGDSAEAVRLVEQVAAIDPDGHWADRANLLRATLPAAEAPAAPDAEVTPTVSFK